MSYDNVLNPDDEPRQEKYKAAILEGFEFMPNDVFLDFMFHPDVVDLDGVEGLLCWIMDFDQKFLPSDEFCAFMFGGSIDDYAACRVRLAEGENGYSFEKRFVGENDYYWEVTGP